ncbi:MAG: DUF6320 domain-containing protein [Eubacteriales bacterium]|nr:DUF6320 domain-containing protein [Eubacteriales bacterium]
MKYCERCGVAVNTPRTKCPLCYGDLTGEAAQEEQYPQPVGHVPEKRRYNVVARIFFFLSILFGAACLITNFLTDRFQSLWSVLVVVGMLYIWLLVRYVIIGRVNIARRLMAQLMGSIVFVLFLEWFITGGVVHGWAFTYAIPAMNVAATTAITMIICIRFLKWTSYTLYQFITALMGLLPLVFWLVGWVQPGVWWPSLASAFYSLATLIGMFIFADRKYKNELLRRFHL